jgi:hypothetical protein
VLAVCLATGALIGIVLTTVICTAVLCLTWATGR